MNNSTAMDSLDVQSSCEGVPSSIDHAKLRQLCNLLRNEGDSILNGTSSFILTTNVLIQLNGDCTRAVDDLDDDSEEPYSYSNSWTNVGRRKGKQLSDADNKQEWKKNIRFIKDFMLSTPSVKIINKSGALPCPINLSRFVNIGTLELRRVPVHMVEGLQMLRGILKSLTVYRCCSKLKDLLELCGSDMSGPLTWPQLTYVRIVFNSIHLLDSSLRLLADVEHLDLSHNIIGTCDDFMEYLGSVKFITLANNLLTTVPTFSMTTRASLTCLILRGNNLDSITGIHELQVLQDLDLGENCIGEHALLGPLKFLTNLKQLLLDGNPIFYHRKHRQSTIAYLSWQAVSVEFELDRRKLSSSEVKYFRPRRTRGLKLSPQPEIRRSVLAARDIEDVAVSASSGIGTADDSPKREEAKPGKGKKKKLKARNTEIRDMEESGELSSSLNATPGTSPAMRNFEESLKMRREEALKTQREVELLKEHYGENYLQAIQERKIFQKVKEVATSTTPSKKKSKKPKKSGNAVSNENTDSDAGTKKEEKEEHVSSSCSREGFTDSMKAAVDSEAAFANAASKSCGFPTEDDLYLKDTNINPIMATIAKLASGQSSSEIDTEAEKDKSITSFTSSFERKITVQNGHLNEANKGSTSGAMNRNSGSDYTDSSALDGNGKTASPKFDAMLHKHEPPSDRITPEKQRDASSSEICSPGKSADVMLSPNSLLTHRMQSLMSEMSSPDTSMQEETSMVHPPPLEHSISDTDSSVDASLQVFEFETESEGIFVTLPKDDNKMIIMTTTDFFIVEKDVQGRITEKLDLRSLRSMEVERIAAKESKALAEADASNKGKEGKETQKNSSTKSVSKNSPKDWLLKLTFDYVRRDRKTRCYIMDSEDGEQITSHFQKFVDTRLEEAKTKEAVLMQCLKCNKTFKHKDAIKKQKQMPTSGTRKDMEALQETTESTECPKCGSSIIIELKSEVPKTVSSVVNTPHGSYSSAGSDMEVMRRQKPLLRKSSFDHTSPSVSKIPRQASVSSLESGMPAGALTSKRSSKELLPSGSSRDRSNAFTTPSNMSRSALLPSQKTTSVDESEELVCVEDYFTSELMKPISTSKELALMTTSLRVQSPSKGTATPRVPLPVRPQSVPKKIQDGANSSFASHHTPSPSNVSRGTPSQSASDLNDARKDTGSLSDRKRGATPVGHLRTASCRSTTAIEEYVNMIVSQGQESDKQDENSLNDSLRQRKASMSIDEFNRSFSNASPRQVAKLRSDSTGSDSSHRVHRSASGSSITVISANQGQEGKKFEDPISECVVFTIGEQENNTGDSGNGSGNVEESSGAVSSPLNSSICSSMVSSVYENSVAEVDSAGTKVDPDQLAITIIGSTDSEKQQTLHQKEESEDEITSIYDRPRKAKVPSKKLNSQSLKQENVENFEPPHEDLSQEQNEACVFSPDGEDENERLLDSGEYGSQLDDFYDEEGGDTALADGTKPCYEFHHLNHRLTLYMMMSLFGNEEDFVCKMQCEVVQYIIQKNYQALFVMSSLRFYILKITSTDHSQDPEKWLSAVEIQPIPELHYIDVGLGAQSLRLEFVTDCSSFTLVTRNRDKTLQFLEVLHTKLANHAVSHSISSHVVVNEDVDQTTLDNLEKDVVSKVIPNQKLLLYCMGYIERGHQKLFPMSFIVTTSDICLVRTNHQWPQPRLQPALSVEDVGKQFIVLERQSISNIASVEVDEDTMRLIKVELFNETDGISTIWSITMATRQSTYDFVNAVSDPWAKAFGIEMEIIYSKLS